MRNYFWNILHLCSSRILVYLFHFCYRIIWCIHQDNARLERVIMFYSHSCSLGICTGFCVCVFFAIILLSCPSGILCNTFFCVGTTRRLLIDGGVMLSYHLCFATGTYETGVGWFLIFYLFIMYLFVLTYPFNFWTHVCTFL